MAVGQENETSQIDELSWNLEAINIQDAWDVTKGSKDITIAIVDSGINWNVTALSVENRWENQLEKDGLPDIDDDNNGFIDDIYGYDFIDFDEDPTTDQTYGEIDGHGTMVSSVVISDNDDVTGIAPNVKLMTVRVLDSNGTGFFSEIYQGMDYAIKNRADIINLSLGTNAEIGGFIDNLMEQLTYKAKYYNVSIVVSAGNEGGSVNFYGKLNNTITVSALDTPTHLASYSNYGNEVDFTAPGSRIPVIDSDNIAYYVSGTSFSAPTVSAVIALMRSIRNDFPVVYYEELLKESAIDIFDKGFDVFSGHGLIDASESVSNTVNFDELDFDDDGMPSGYEFQFAFNPFYDDGFVDHDGDGVVSLFEYKDGTNPRDPNDFKSWITRSSTINYIIIPGTILIVTIISLIIYIKKDRKKRRNDFL